MRWAPASRSCISLAVALLAVGCSRKQPGAHPEPVPLEVHVLADTANRHRLAVTPPPLRARVWLTRVAPAPAAPEASLPDAAPDSTIPEQGHAPIEAGEALTPPVLIGRGTLVPPAHAAGLRGPTVVELEVHVAESGRVLEATWVGGTSDQAWIEAAVRCAIGMRFVPARLHGRPVPVWCRERFDLSAAEPPR